MFSRVAVQRLRGLGFCIACCPAAVVLLVCADAAEPREVTDSSVDFGHLPRSPPAAQQPVWETTTVRKMLLVRSIGRP
jgi:hypothetical protein